MVIADAIGQAVVQIRNCGPVPVELPRDMTIGVIENISMYEIAPISPAILNAAAEKEYEEHRNKMVTAEKRKYIQQTADLKGVPAEYREEYLQVLLRHHEAFSDHKNDIGRARMLQHEIHLKDPNPVYVKQFKIADTHKDYLEEQVREWLKMGIIESTLSRYNSPMFLVSKKDGG